jgi:hypothetical protein
MVIPATVATRLLAGYRRLSWRYVRMARSVAPSMRGPTTATGWRLPPRILLLVFYDVRSSTLSLDLTEGPLPPKVVDTAAPAIHSDHNRQPIAAILRRHSFESIWRMPFARRVSLFDSHAQIRGGERPCHSRGRSSDPGISIWNRKEAATFHDQRNPARGRTAYLELYG